MSESDRRAKKNKERKQVILKMQQHTLKPKHSLANYMGEWRQHGKIRRQLSFIDVKWLRLRRRPFVLYAVALLSPVSHRKRSENGIQKMCERERERETEGDRERGRKKSKIKENHLNYLWNRTVCVFTSAFVAFPSGECEARHGIAQPNNDFDVQNVASNRLKYIPK